MGLYVVAVEFPGAGLKVPSLFFISQRNDSNEPTAVNSILDDPSSFIHAPLVSNVMSKSNLGGFVNPE